MAASAPALQASPLGCETAAPGQPFLVFGLVNDGQEPVGLSIPKAFVVWEEERSDFDRAFEDAVSPQEEQGLVILGVSRCGPQASR